MELLREQVAEAVRIFEGLREYWAFMVGERVSADAVASSDVSKSVSTRFEAGWSGGLEDSSKTAFFRKRIMNATKWLKKLLQGFELRR